MQSLVRPDSYSNRARALGELLEGDSTMPSLVTTSTGRGEVLTGGRGSVGIDLGGGLPRGLDPLMAKSMQRFEEFRMFQSCLPLLPER